MSSNRSGKPLVSVVVLTYNSEAFVLDTLNSIKCQSYQKLELIISDDASTDNTVALCEEWLLDNSHRFISATLLNSKTNTGIAPNCNRGWRAARGEWIKFIAGDDALEIDALANFMDYLKSNEKAEVIFSRMNVFKETFCSSNAITVKSSSNRWFNDTSSTAEDQFRILLRYNCVNAPTVILKKAVLVSLNGFDEEFPFLEDWPMWLKIAKAGKKMHYLDSFTVKYRQHGKSVQQLINRKVYLSRTEAEIDKMFLNDYLQYLPLPERLARKATIVRNKLFSTIFRNQNNNLISVTSFIAGIIPFLVLRQYRRRLL
jgi:glycosyltransferase involved in cell wall biosynthesis